MKNVISNKTNLTNRVVLLLILEFVTVVFPVFYLGKYFEFPDILRQPAAFAFEKFKLNENNIVFGYYIFLVSALLYIPLSYCLVRLLNQTKSKTAKVTFIGLGITTTVFQSIGFIRWIFTMPYLTELYFKGAENKSIAIALYEMLNRHAGMSIGEHLGFISMGFWTICLSIIIVKHPKMKNFIGFCGIFIGILSIFSVAEHFGGELASSFGLVNFIANTFWSIWLLLILFYLPKK
jgi:hypothetical protein